MRLLFVLMLFFSSLVLSVSAFEVIVDPPIAWQGKVITVRLVSAEAVEQVKASFLGKQFECYKSAVDFKGVAGVPIDQKPGYYNLKIFLTQEDGFKKAITKKVKVWSTNFPFSKFYLKPARNKLRARKIINNEWAEIEKYLIVKDPKQWWQGRFGWPVKDRVSQGFGHRQIINNKRAGAHRGVDIAVPVGTQINAPNKGKVVFAKKLKAFGGTMVIDHGQGVQTLYFHLSKFIAKVGQTVEKGALIALSGNSGVSSGAHLHWGMSVHNLRVDPLQWVNNDI